MTAFERVRINLLLTKVPGLDEVLGGGLPEYSLNLLSGGPGAGKTTLAMQILFANATPRRPGLFFTILGESTLKLLRYQQQFTFFDLARIGNDIHILNLSDEVIQGGPQRVLERIQEEVDASQPGIVVMDSFPSVFRAGASRIDMVRFMQRLALQLSSWEATSLLIAEELHLDLRAQVFTVADAVLLLSQETDRNSVVRKLQILKQRGCPPMPGLHTMRVTEAGVQVFPRMPEATVLHHVQTPRARLSIGIPELDRMMGGGIPAGDAVVIAGPTGTGKTTFAARFLAEGAARGDSAVVLLFEERPADYLRRALGLGLDLAALEKAGRLRILYLRPLDLSVDEALYEVRAALVEIGATRLVIDSLSGFELALAPTFREDFRESLYRLVTSITTTGVTVLMTVETISTREELRLLPQAVSFLADDIIMQRLVEVDGALRPVLAVVKMRRSRHSRALREYEITGTSVVIGHAVDGHESLVPGAPRPQVHAGSAFVGLTMQEAHVLETVMRLRRCAQEEIIAETGLPPEQLGRIFGRLRELDFIERDASGEGEVWRAVAHPPGE